MGRSKYTVKSTALISPERNRDSTIQPSAAAVTMLAMPIVVRDGVHAAIASRSSARQRHGRAATSVTASTGTSTAGRRIRERQPNKGAPTTSATPAAAATRGAVLDVMIGAGCPHLTTTTHPSGVRLRQERHQQRRTAPRYRRDSEVAWLRAAASWGDAPIDVEVERSRPCMVPGGTIQPEQPPLRTHRRCEAIVAESGGPSSPAPRLTIYFMFRQRIGVPLVPRRDPRAAMHASPTHEPPI